MKDWNPDLYMQFGSERTQPAMDLIARIRSDAPAAIIDIGCGPGNSTQALAKRWPTATITGLDSSPAMIEKARQGHPDQRWEIADAFRYTPETRYDIAFSNAVIQWIPDHPALLKKLHGILSDRGILAVQIPLFWDMPLGKIIHETSQDVRWKARTQDVFDLFTIHDYVFYFDHLSELFNAVEIWETQYLQIMDSHRSIIEMMRSTGLKPYHERLASEAERKNFEAMALKGIEAAYPIQQNGKVILPFKRLFFIGYK